MARGAPPAEPAPGVPRAHVAHRHADASALAGALADDVAARLRAAVAARGHAVLAVSGGRSPVAFFHALRARRLPWDRVTVTLVDERCVPPAHPDSNARLVREHLLVGEAQRARFVPLVEAADRLPGASGAPDACDTLSTLAASAEARIAALDAIDVAVLGMGTDGHTASLFAPVAHAAGALDPHGSRRCAALVPPHAPHARVTLTFAGLLRARHLALQLAGAAKRAVYEAACDGPDPERAVSLLLDQRRVPLDAWIAEHDADG